MTSPSKSELLLDAAARAARYVAEERDRPVFPATGAVDRLGSLQFNATLDRPLDAADVIEMLDEIGGAATVASTGGRYFGFVTGGVEPVGLAASVLAGAWDQNAALPAMSPVAAHLDALAAEWIVDLLGLPDRHGGDLLRRCLDREPHGHHHGARHLASSSGVGHSC